MVGLCSIIEHYTPIFYNINKKNKFFGSLREKIKERIAK